MEGDTEQNGTGEGGEGGEVRGGGTEGKGGKWEGGKEKSRPTVISKSRRLWIQVPSPSTNLLFNYPQL